VTLMRFGPFRELDRLAEQTLSAGARALHSMPMEAIRRGDEFIVHLAAPGVGPDDVNLTVECNVGDNLDADRLTADPRDGVLTLTIPVSEASKPRRVVLGSANRPSDGPNLVAGSAPTSTHEAAAAGTEPVAAGAGSES
jgi:HSP20 family protein